MFDNSQQNVKQKTKGVLHKF